MRKVAGKAGAYRFYDAALKLRILHECARGDRSIAAVARAHGLSAKRIYQWRHDATVAQADRGAGFKRIELSAVAPASPNAKDSIRIELARGDQTICLHWPVAHASALLAWLDQP
ncbi:MAG TPA: transposase [Burkholderiaceae bacterium]|nr:transposase [Burkholderiaceae bacterium]